MIRKLSWVVLFVAIAAMLVMTHEMNEYMDAVNQQLDSIEQRLDAYDR